MHIGPEEKTKPIQAIVAGTILTTILLPFQNVIELDEIKREERKSSGLCDPPFHPNSSKPEQKHLRKKKKEKKENSWLSS